MQNLWPIVTRGIVLRAMSEDNLRQAILKPLQAKLPDKRMEPELLSSLAHDTAESVAYLPLLQVTLQELWKKGRLKRAAYQHLVNAIRQRAEAVYQYSDHARSAPHEERPPADRTLMLDMLLDLVQVSLDDDARHDVRQRQAKPNLIAGSLSRARLIEELVAARLLSVSIAGHDDNAIEYVDIIHEALIREWERLQQAIKDNREQLRWRQRFEQSLNDWQQAQRADEHLLSQVRLNEARQPARAK